MVTATTTAPTQTDQYLDALGRANSHRLSRLEISRGIAAGTIDPCDLLREPPNCIYTMEIYNLLIQQHRWGKTRTLQFLAKFQISPTRSVMDCTQRQRELIASRLGPQFKRPKVSPDNALDRSTPQRTEALQHANQIRIKRAVLKREIRQYKQTASNMLRNPPEWCKAMKVSDLILAVPKIGRAKRSKIMGQCRVSSKKSVDGLSPRQRAALLAELDGR